MQESDFDNSRDWNKVSRDIFKEGFREGALKGKDLVFQKGFDIGYQEGFKIGQTLGYTNGIFRISKKDEADFSQYQSQINNPTLGNCIICQEEKNQNPLIFSELIENQKKSNNTAITNLKGYSMNILK